MELKVRALKDVHDLSLGLQGWEQLYRQMSPGQFEGTVAQAEVQDFQFFRETTNRRITQTGISPEKFSSIALPLTADASGTFQGMHFDGYALGRGIFG